jgi:hypothetical protein
LKSNTKENNIAVNRFKYSGGRYNIKAFLLKNTHYTAGVLFREGRCSVQKAFRRHGILKKVISQIKKRLLLSKGFVCPVPAATR